ncbi:MAG: hypothetical protein ACXWQ6_04910 [Candidatus Limnocylindrales bacterium]
MRTGLTMADLSDLLEPDAADAFAGDYVAAASVIRLVPERIRIRDFRDVVAAAGA